MDGVIPAIVDGVLRPDGRVDILLLGGGFSQGEGLFETLPVVDGRPHFLSRHARRLARGAEELDLTPAPEESTWASDIAALVSAASESQLAVRLFLFRDGEQVRRAVAAETLASAPLEPANVGLAVAGLEGARPLAHLKTLNYLAPRRAWTLGRGAGFDEVLFVLDDGTVLEGSRSTVFMVKDEVLRTAPLELPILPGVTREVLLEEARGAGIIVSERPFRLSDLKEADEVFLTASLRGVRPVRAVCGAGVRTVNGPVTGQLAALYQARVGVPG